MQKLRDRKPVQLGLFHRLVQTPTWAALPAEVRQKTIRLLSRLVRHHWERQGQPHVKEAGNE